MINKTLIANPRVALVAIGIGRIRRGYERYFSELFGVIRPHLDVTLYKGAGQRSAHERIPPLLGLTTGVARALPFKATSGEYQRYKSDCAAFALSLLPELVRQRFDVIHVIDYPLAKVLCFLRNICPFRGRFVLTNGCCIPPEYYPRVDHIHHVAQPFFEEALAAGVPESRLTMVPCGLHTGKFQTHMGRRELRKKYSIPEDTFVVLAVSALMRMHKRVDHIIEEVSCLKGDVLLWIDGEPSDPTIPELARCKLGAKCRITHVPSHEVADLYHLADVMVQASLADGFGLAAVEALSTGLMLLTHDSEHHAWLVQDRDCLVDMSARGKLADRLCKLQAQKAPLVSRAELRATSVCRRFDWKSVAPAYIQMYRKVTALPKS